jgi:glycosyltransferase involved in cell wall biosynthesis
LRSDLEVRAKRLGLDGHLLFAGFVPRLREFLPGLDILVNPSFSEEMPNIVLEAMAAEVPVVATSVGGVPEIAGPDRAVSLAPPGDAEALAQAVSSILRDPFEARRLAGRGRARVGLVFSLMRQRELLHTLYRELLSPGRAKIVRESVSPAKLEHLHP